jgi:hypothetical protein
MLSLSSPLLLCFSGAAPAPPAKEGLFDCTVTKAGHIEMHTRPGSKTLPYKSSYCEFRGNQNEIKSCSGLDSVHPGCNNCTLSSQFSCTCSCTCPAGGATGQGDPCEWEWSGTAVFDPSPVNFQCSCNGEPFGPKPPPPPKVSPPPPPKLPPPPPPPCNATLDIVIVLDGSASILDPDWQTDLSFTQTVVNSFNISSDQVEIGIVQFSDGAEVVIGLSPDKAAILAAVKNLRQDKGGTNTRAGFLKAKSILDTSHRPGSAGQIVIIVTDGDQNQGLPAESTASALKAEGVTIFGVGVGPDVKQSKIEKWVSLPVSEHDFPVSDWGSLQAILKKLIAAACPPTPPPM